MAGVRTHALIGAVAGLALTRGLGLSLTPTDPLPWLLIGGSTLAATLPDIDEPQAWIAQHARRVLTLVGTLLTAGSAALLPMAGLPLLGRVLLGALCGWVLLGPLLARCVLRLIRRAAGGHRRLTHSLVVAAALAGLAWGGWQAQLLPVTFVSGVLAYAITVHDLGDLVTPAGVPVFYPLSSIRVGLPRPLARHGEGLIALLAVALGLWLLQGGGHG